jgi:maltooligosyltrehalose trehalohydrolase
METAPLAMTDTGDGYFEASIRTNRNDLRYTYVLNTSESVMNGGFDRPDPASAYQPEGVHGPSAVVDHRFDWKCDSWRGIPLQDYIIYEMHIGVFTLAGTFDAAIDRIPYLKELGVTAVEVMPVAACPGERNWGYDGVYPYAVQGNYGGPAAFKRFVDACHEAGLAVVLDVVYNHLGPEGNYLRDFGPYFTARHQTPWGEAINYDGPDSAPVRHYFVQNALYWVTEYRVDALRLDATDTIYDLSPRHFLEELAAAVSDRADALNRRIYTIAESAANDARWIRRREQGGFGLNAQWNDDHHHALHRQLTGERQGYYADYPHFSQLAKGLREGFIYTGEHSVYRKRTHGSPSADLPAKRFVVCIQNHDQVGNRMRGDRLGHSLPLAALKLAACWVLLSPYIPLVFMGEEYNESAPFPYFVSHTDEDLIAAVRKGRSEEFAAFAWEGEPPDPQSEDTFLSAKIRPSQREDGNKAELFAFYQKLIRLRKTVDCFASGSREGLQVVSHNSTRTLFVQRDSPSGACVQVFHFEGSTSVVLYPFETGDYRILVDSSRSESAFEDAIDAQSAHLAHGQEITLEPYAVRVWQSANSRSKTVLHEIG